MNKSNYRNDIQNGFTLIELMMVLAVALVTLGIGLPSFEGAIADARLVSQTNNVVAALNAARATAISEHYESIVAPITGTSWQNGFQVFIDKNGNQSADDGEIIQTFEAVNGDITLVPNNPFKRRVTYKPDGRSVAGSFYICSNADLKTFRRITIAGTGRIRTEKPEASGLTPSGESYAGNCT